MYFFLVPIRVFTCPERTIYRWIYTCIDKKHPKSKNKKQLPSERVKKYRKTLSARKCPLLPLNYCAKRFRRRLNHVSPPPLVTGECLFIDVSVFFSFHYNAYSTGVAIFER